MSTPRSTKNPAEQSGWATGLATFAAAMLLLVGFFQVFEGLVAVFNDNFYVVTSNYTFNIDTTAYSWTHIVIGAILIATGISLIVQQTWARITASRSPLCR
jgi:hypothetical protein